MSASYQMSDWLFVSILWYKLCCNVQNLSVGSNDKGQSKQIKNPVNVPEEALN